MPTRVVDIGKEELRLLETYNQTGLKMVASGFWVSVIMLVLLKKD